MMDIALITANANQLRYILEFGKRNPVFYAITTLIVISLLLQVTNKIIIIIVITITIFHLIYIFVFQIRKAIG